MINYQFNMEEWLPRFPLQSDHHYSGEMITGPRHLCNNEQLRKEVRDQIDWGPAEQVDVFVMALGEPADRHVTKIGGLPYRPRNEPWPVGLYSRKPLTFLAQFCFADSKDIVGELPGDVLLVFGSSPEEFPEPDAIDFEWYSLGLRDLAQQEDCLQTDWWIQPTYGLIYRTASYPQAKRIVPSEQQTYLQCGDRDVWSEYWLYQYQATQIGRAPFYIQGDPKLPGHPLCCISSLGPDMHQPFPLVNRPEPLCAQDVWQSPLSDKLLMLGDTGAIYISIDHRSRLHYSWDCY